MFTAKREHIDTEYYCIPPVHNEQSVLSSTSGINLPESQSHNNTAPKHVNTTRENEQEDMSKQCAYEKQPERTMQVSLMDVTQTMVLTLILIF